MVRNDFVSNSSSCSFIIHLDTKKSLEDFKKIYDDIVNNYKSDVIYHCDNYRQRLYNLDNLEIGDEVEIYSGEDDNSFAIQNFELLKDFITENFNFTIYCDSTAHVTFGEWRKK